MTKKSLYPKTSRIKNSKVRITEKLDGSNIGFFKINGELIIAQRNYVFKQSELTKTNSYKGLIGWLDENADSLDICEGSGVFGEWIGMGCIKYGESLDKKFYIFAKANIDENLDVRNILYQKELFQYPFESQEIPTCMGVVPEVTEFENVSVESLDDLYETYSEEVGRNVEGFIINTGGQITKYVRHKDGNRTNHKS